MLIFIYQPLLWQIAVRCAHFPPPCFFSFTLLALVLWWSWWCNVVVIVMKFTPGHSCSILLVWIALTLFTLPNWWTLGYFSSFTIVNSAMENTFGHFKNYFSFLTSWNINLHDLTFYEEREGIGGNSLVIQGKPNRTWCILCPVPGLSWSRN